MAKLGNDWQKKYVEEFCSSVRSSTNINELLIDAREIIACKDQQWFVRECWPVVMQKVNSLRAGKPPKIHIVVDLQQHLHAIWYASRGDGNVARNVAKAVGNVAKKFNDAPLIIADDCKAKSFRYGIYDKYKSNRKEKEQGFYQAHQEALDNLKADGFNIVTSPDGYEADDLIASLCMTGSIAGDKVVINSNDRDLWQCLGPQVTSWTKNGFYSAKDLEKEHRIKPYQVVDWLTLSGKESNTIPGAEGIGDVTASSLIEKYGTVLGVYDHIESLSQNEKVYKALKDFESKWYHCYRLHRLVNTLEVAWTI